MFSFENCIINLRDNQIMEKNDIEMYMETICFRIIAVKNN
jgi:hypothetical protein